ncbi:four helix bundle protein [Kordia sp. YSTF-M3]|uniref:Four helix bundle protein n=1 Tax=Kordia aestuariivivens TaxID=2759037 RepID=A0ABR7QDC5_9FLAO|nr:four helix bundle protein [Kordia aestuariivivens]MBC8756587.1 four helix bundle protein [Kordia aestuariivivens]
MRDFRKLDVWKSAIDLVADVYEILEQLPDVEKFGLRSQISRAVVSIPSNIAEGSAKDSQKDFARFLKIGLGSAFEIETQFVICMRLSYISDEDGTLIIEKIQTLQKRINSLVKYVKTQYPKT